MGCASVVRPWACTADPLGACLLCPGQSAHTKEAVLAESSISICSLHFCALCNIGGVWQRTDQHTGCGYKGRTMCFSALASFGAGAVLLAIGGASTRRTRRAVELPYALIPLCFGVQQLLEGALWLTLPLQAQCANAWLTQGYSAFSQVIWPIYIPLAVYLLERPGWRRRLIGLIALSGAGVALYLLWCMVKTPVLAQISGSHIAYVFPHFHQPLATVLYLFAACVSPLLSAWPRVRLFGLLASVSLVAAAYFYSQWFISTWCFFAALLSAVVWLQFARGPQAAAAAAAPAH